MKAGRLKVFGAVVGTAVGLAALAPTSAWALDKASTWATSGNPLIANAYGSSATGYGSFKVTRTSNGTVARAFGYNKIRNVDNHKAYFELQAQSNAGVCQSGYSLAVDILGTGGAFGQSYSCTQSFYDFGGLIESGHTSSSTFVYSTADKVVDSTANVMRGRVRECVDVPLRPDTCTGFNYSGADSY